MENEKYGILIEGGNGYAIYEKNGILTISWPTGVADVPVYRPLGQVDYQEFKDGKRTMSDLSFKAAYGTWPLSQEEQEKVKKGRAEERPIILISNPKNQKLFSKEELERLIPIAEKQWIDWEGKLPENYVSPLT